MQDRLARIDVTGQPLDGYAEANKRQDVILEDRWFE
jgi:hypothetical protein